MTAGAVLAPTLAPLRLLPCDKPKKWVDTKTLIEIKCETPNTEIYYTVNGSAPNPYSWFGFDYKTFKYCQPLLLDEGRCVIKAIAVDPVKHRESFVVTKTFYVEKADDEKFENKICDDKDGTEEMEKESERNFEDLRESDEEEEADDEEGEGENMSATFTMSEGSVKDVNLMENEENYDGEMTKEMEFTQPSVLNRDKITQLLDSLRCIQCSYVNHANPAAQFCSFCGNQLKNKMAYALSLPCLQQMTNCTKCLCKVPQNVPYCIICETSFEKNNYGKNYDKINERKMCTYCYTVNPAKRDSCVMCNVKLPNTSPITSTDVTKRKLLLPTIVHTSRDFAKCENCGRMNSRESRYCDWCGKIQVAKEELVLECPQCNNKNQSDACFCHSCGYPLQPPVNLDLNGRLIKKTFERGVSARPHSRNKSTWTTITSDSKSVQTVESTSYLSQKWYRSMERMRQVQRNAAFESNLNLRSVSPGNGYWRQQVDHIAGHLKVFACNDNDFRSQISKTKLTSLISATVEEHRTDFAITLTFATHQTPNETKKSKQKPKKTISEKPKPKPKNFQLVKTEQEVDILKAFQTTTDRNEFKNIITKCLDDQNYLSFANTTLLSLVIQSGQCEMIPFIVSAGYDCNIANPDGNPPLHEAVLLRDKGLDAVKELLKCGADTEIVNRRGLTAYQLANSVDNQSAVGLLNNHLGKNMLDQLINSDFRNNF